MLGIERLFGGSPEQQGTLAAIAQIAQASGPQRLPQSLYSILGGGLMAGQQATQQAREQQQINQLRDFAIRDKRSDYETQEAQRARAKGLLELNTAFQKLRGRQQSAPPVHRSANAAFQGLLGGGALDVTAPGAPMQAPVAGGGSGRGALVQQRLDYAQYLRDNGYGAEAQAEEDSALKLQPKVKGWEKVQVQGKVMFAPFFEDGTNGQPVPLEVAEKLDSINRGGQTDLVNPITGATVRSLANTASPDALLSAATQRQRMEFDRQQGRKPVYDAERGMLIDTQTGMASPVRGAGGAPLPTKDALQRTNDATAVIDLLDQATPLIDNATSSYGGAALDQAARVFGVATNGAQSAAQLKAIEGSLISKMPKMSGPQSDKDVLLYRQMAGQIGDPTVPAETKKAAMQSIREINQRYLGGQQPAAAAPQGSKTATMADIAATARASGRSTAEVTAALRAKGYQIVGGQ